MAKSVVELKDGRKVPLLAVGTAYGSPREVGILVDFALTMGLRHIDVVPVPEIETVVGQVLSSWLLSGRIRRQEIFITAKLPSQDMKSTRVKRFLLRTLLNLRLSYVDAYIISCPIACKESYEIRPISCPQTNFNDIWTVMEEMEDDGLIRALGVAHFNLQQIQKIREYSKIQPMIIQIEFHPYLQEKHLTEYCKVHKIQIVAIIPPIFIDHETVDFQNPLDEDLVLHSMTKNGRNVEQVLFKWIQQKRFVILCEKVSIIHITKCLQIFNFELSNDQLKAIDRLDKERRFYIPTCLTGFESHADYPFKKESIK